MGLRGPTPFPGAQAPPWGRSREAPPRLPPNRTGSVAAQATAARGPADRAGAGSRPGQGSGERVSRPAPPHRPCALRLNCARAEDPDGEVAPAPFNLAEERGALAKGGWLKIMVGGYVQDVLGRRVSRARNWEVESQWGRSPGSRSGAEAGVEGCIGRLLPEAAVAGSWGRCGLLGWFGQLSAGVTMLRSHKSPRLPGARSRRPAWGRRPLAWWHLVPAGSDGRRERCSRSGKGPQARCPCELTCSAPGSP